MIQYAFIMSGCLHAFMDAEMDACMGLYTRLSECLETIRNPHAGILTLQFAWAYTVRICVSYWYEACSADLSKRLADERRDWWNQHCYFQDQRVSFKAVYSACPSGDFSKTQVFGDFLETHQAGLNWKDLSILQKQQFSEKMSAS